MRDAFLRRLLELHQACGSPAYALVARTSSRLNETHPVPGGSASLPALSKTALSETLNGHRKGLPDHGFVASFVLSCYRIAHEQGILAEDPGREALPRWQDMLREAEEESERLGLPRRRLPTGPLGDLTAPVRLTAVQCELLAVHGAFGRELAHRAQAREPRAVYQAAVLIAAAPGRDEDAVSLLTIAAAARDPDALELLQASPRELDRAAAAAHAGELAREAGTTGRPQAARAFRACAAALDGAGIAAPDTADAP
nr:hypothetical protein GCM10010200_077330 [Actinomadura rugatobispora]